VLKFLADENLHGTHVQALRRRSPQLDLVRAQNTDQSGVDAPTVLAWAAEEGRTLLTHDVTTMTAFAYDRVRVNLRVPGVFEVDQRAPIARLVEDLLLLAERSLAGEWEGQVHYLPL
jgi:hypothetical protein